MKFAKTVVVALTNNKGGCGKTTSSISLAAAFNHLGYSVAVVDTDPQCNTTAMFDVDPDKLLSEGKLSLLDAYMNRRAAVDIQIGFGARFDDRLFLVPSNRSLGSVGPHFDAEVIFHSTKPNAAEIDSDDMRKERKHRLKKSIDSLRGVHDIVILDTPPELNFLTTTALIAADYFIIPVFPSSYDLEGLENLTRAVNKIRDQHNPSLKLAGVLLGNFEKNRNLHTQIYGFLINKFGEEAVFKSVIGHGVKMQELTFMKKTVFEYKEAGRQAEEFLELAREMINRGSKGESTINPLPKLEDVLRNADNNPDVSINLEELQEAANG